MKSLGLAVLLATLAAVSASGILAGHGIILGGHAGAVTGLGAPAVIAGPAGSVVRGGLAHAGSTVIAGPAGIAAPGLIGGLGLGAGIIGGHGLIAPGSGWEGQYVPDLTEHLYDDGSYKPWVYGH